MARSHDNGWTRSQDEQANRELCARMWLVNGGNGHEDGEEGIRALTVTGEGLIDFLAAYEEFLLNGPNS